MLDEGLYLPVRWYSNLQFQDSYLQHCEEVWHREYVVASCSSLMPFQIAVPYNGTDTIDLTQAQLIIVNLDVLDINGQPTETDLSDYFTPADWEQYNDLATATTYISYLGNITDFNVCSGLSYFELYLVDSLGASLPVAYSERFIVNCDCDLFGEVFTTGEFRRWASQLDLRKSDTDDLRIVKE